MATRVTTEPALLAARTRAPSMALPSLASVTSPSTNTGAKHACSPLATGSHTSPSPHTSATEGSHTSVQVASAPSTARHTKPSLAVGRGQVTRAVGGAALAARGDPEEREQEQRRKMKQRYESSPVYRC
jgi:hypothetical protein